MDTRLKNLTKRNMEILLGGQLIIWSIAVTYARVFHSYAEQRYYWSAKGLAFYQIAAVVLAIVSLLLGVVLLLQVYFYWKKWEPLKNLKACRPDFWNTELLVLVLVISGNQWLGGVMGSGDIYLMGGPLFPSIVVNSLYNLVKISLLLVVFSGCFYGSVLLLARQKLLGIMPETSAVWRQVKRYRNSTPLEKKLRQQKKRPLILAGILGIGIVGFIIAALNMWSETCAIVAVLLAGLTVLVILKAFLGDKTAWEMGCLLRQIEAMYTGQDMPREYELSEKSLLYEASGQLKNIRTAMQKSVEKQVQAERLKIDLITNVSHDLKTPLTSMVGYTDLLKKEELSDEARDYVEVISVKQEQLKEMIQDLFELSKATSGVEQLVMETLDMRRLLEQTLGDMADAVEESGRDVRTRFMGENLHFSGDNGKMYRVVQNLLENALKYSLPGTRIYLEAGRKERQIWMEIKNISAYEMDFNPKEITERFVRGDKSRTTQGHGLGLAIATSFVQNMGGSLEVAIDGDLFKVTLRFPAVQQ